MTIDDILASAAPLRLAKLTCWHNGTWEAQFYELNGLTFNYGHGESAFEALLAALIKVRNNEFIEPPTPKVYEYAETPSLSSLIQATPSNFKRRI